MRHNFIIKKPVIINDSSFDNSGKIHMYTSRHYPMVDAFLVVSDDLKENDNGTHISYNKKLINESIIRESFFYEIEVKENIKLYNSISKSIIYSDNIPVIPLPLLDGDIDVKNIPIIFNDTDKIKKENGNNITIIFDEDIPEKTCSIYWTDDNNFDCFCSPDFTTINDFQVSCFSTNDFGFVYNAFGTTLKTEILPTILTNVSNGEQSNISIDFRPYYNMNMVYGTGETVSMKSLERNLRIPTRVGIGENVKTSIKYTISPNIAAIASDGSGLSSDIFYAITNNLVPVVYTGENTNFVLNISTTMVFVSLAGENVKPALTTNTTINPIISHGDDIKKANITYKALTSFKSSSFVGENVKSPVIVQSTFSPIIGHGENYGLNLKYAEGTRWITDVAVGESTSFDFVNTVFFSPSFSSGENIAYNLTRRDAYDLNPRFEIGDNFKGGNLSLSPSLLPRIGTGENLARISLDRIPNWYVHGGETVTTNIAITKSFDNNKFSSGENLKMGLRYAPSEPIGNFKVNTGEGLYCHLNTLISTSFTSTSSFNMGFEPTFWDTTYIDLNRNNGCCLPSKNDLLYVNLQKDKEVEIDYSIKDKLKMVADLSVVRLFDIDISAGETFEVVEYNNYFEVDFYEGTSSKTIDLYMDLDVNLSNGNLDYNGSLFIETFKEYQSIRTAHNTSYSGESVSFELSTYEKLVPSAYDGTVMNGSLWTVEAWRTRMTHGWGLYATLNTTMKIYPRFNMGDSVRGRFYEQPYIIGTGEGVSCDLVLDFDVEFLEDGCLENNHIPTDKDGVPIIDDMNEMVIEGYYYSRFIKGRCY